MNRFEKEYIKIINEWNSNLILEANLKSLIPNIQQSILGNKSYSELTEQEKQNLQNNINKQLNDIEQQVNNITDNKQYQSWIYQILKSNEVSLTDLKPISNTILDFIKLAKRPDIKPQQKNIQNYNSLNSLKEFIDSFKEQHKLQNNIYKNLKKVYNNDEFVVYFINKDQCLECNKLFGSNEYFNTGWCIAKNEEYFNQYINENKDKYNGYFVFVKDNKPYALLHYGSYQFKDTSDEILITNNPNIIDCLMHINNNLNDYNKNDLLYYGKPLFSKEHPDATKEDWIAFEIGGEYDPATKTIDCKYNAIKFKNEWLDENGTFNFNFINATDDWSDMFCDCYKLTKLPENFSIPNNVMDCNGMFDGCENLIELPDNFNIPNSVKYCAYMFGECIALTELPNNFSISDNIKVCYRMFSECENLTKLPDNFTIPNNVKNCKYMFYACKNLIELPDNFTIPNNVIDCSGMFDECENLIKLPNNFSIPKNSSYYNIFNNSGLEGKYNIKDLLR